MIKPLILRHDYDAIDRTSHCHYERTTVLKVSATKQAANMETRADLNLQDPS